MSNTNVEVPKSFIELMKQAFKSLVSSPEPIKFGSATLEDGSVIQWEGDQPMPGTPITTVTPDGQTAPVPDGTYTNPADGMQIVVEGGVIASVVPANATDPNANQSATANEGMSDPNATVTASAKEITKRIEEIHKFAEDEITALKENLKTLSENFASAKDEAETLKKENTELKESFVKFAEQATKAIETLGEQPQVTPVVPVVFREEQKQIETDEERRARIFGKK